VNQRVDISNLDAEASDMEAFKIALATLSPPGKPSRGLTLMKAAIALMQLRAEKAERENEELRAELAKLKQAKT